MPFVRRLIFKGENKCETAQQHSNWSVFSDQYFHPPTVDREGKKKDKEQIHHYYLSCVQIQKWDCLWHGGRQPSSTGSTPFFFLLTLHLLDQGLWGSTSYPTCYRQDLLYWPHFYAIIHELFIRPAAHWWTDAVPYHQHISYAYRTTPLISLSFLLVLSASLSCIMPADWHHITASLFLCIPLQLLSLRDMNIKSLISFLTPPLRVSHICLLTPSALDMTQILGHTCSAETWSRLGMAFICGPGCFPAQSSVTESGGKAHLCSPTHAVLTISTSSTLSFGSGALTNIPHKFLMHSHTVVLFFFRYCAR